MKRTVIGLTAVALDAPCRFSGRANAPPPDAQNVTRNRNSCEVPSLAQRKQSAALSELTPRHYRAPAR
jgi:hypothetical protein